MSFRTFFWGWFRLLFAIHAFLGLLFGYWDIRLSDMLIYHSQMASVHYYRTLQFHFALAVVAALALSLYLSRYHWKRTQTLDRERVIPAQVSLAVFYLLFLILGIKLNLILLDSHLLDLEGLLWTGGLLVACIIISVLFQMLAQRIHRRPDSNRIAAIAFLTALILTGIDYSLYSRSSHAAAAKAGTPNVLLIVADTLRWDHVSAYGYPKSTTPNLDRLAGEGALYVEALSTSPWTTPSHASLFTGQYPSRNGVEGRNIYLDPAATTLAAQLTRHGFQTAGFINNVYIRRQTGMAKGFQQYEEFWGRNEGSSLPLLIELIGDTWFPRADTGALETRQAVEDWLEKDWNSENPFFLFVHFMEPHAPYGDPPMFLSQFLPREVTPEEARKVNQDPEMYICGKLPMTPQDFEILNALYDNDIRYLDQEIGKLLDSFRGRGLLDNTLVVFVSDHGEHFGEHGLMSHELSVYDALIRIPLILRHPSSIPAGTRISHVVQTVDLFPSILRFLNVPAGNLELQGANLLPTSLERAGRPFAYAEYNNARAIDKIERRFPGFSSPTCRKKTLRAVRSSELKLILGDDGTRELYNIRSDPHEKRELSAELTEEARVLEDVLKKWMISFEASRFFRKEDVSREALEELKALGYVQ